MFISAQTIKITELQSLELAGVGIAITIAVLAFLMGFVYLLAFIIRKIEASGFSLASLIKKKKVAEEVSSPEILPEKASGSAGEVALNDVPPATAAMLMAIVADEMQTPINELKFISIKEIKE